MTVEARTNFIGLATNVGRLNAPAGALDVAENVVIRKPGVIEPRPGLTDIGLTGSPASVTINKIWEYDGKVHVLASGTWRMYTDATKRTLVNTAGTTIDPALFRNDLVPIAQARGNCYVGTQKGVLKLTGSTDTAFDESGVNCPIVVPPLFLTASGTALETGNKVAYCAVVKRTDANGLVTRGIPTPPRERENTTGTTRDITVTIDTPPASFAGSFELSATTDEIEVYRTRAFATTVTVDGEFALVKTLAATPGATMTFVDSLTDAQRGAILYTSPSQGGAAVENQRPPACGCMETFKGHVFFGNTVGPFRKLVSANFTPTSALATATGIGYRQDTGTTVLGSPIITGLADTSGLQAGMVMAKQGSEFPANTYIISVDSGTQVTVSEDALAGTTSICIFMDSILVDGNWHPIFPLNVDCTLTFGAPVVSSISMISNLGGTPAADFSTTYYARGVSPALPPYTYTVIIEELTRSSSGASTPVLKATHGDEYYPALDLYADSGTPMDRDVFPNGIAWSKQDEPEHVPPLNYALVGDKKKHILGLACTRDSLFIIKEDGIWRLSGSGGNGAAAWRIDPFDLTTFCVLPQSIQKLNNRIYFLSNKGVVRLSDQGIEVLSAPINDEVKRVIGGCYTRYASDGYYSIDSTANHSCTVHALESEYMLSIASTANTLSGMLVYNELTNAWTTWRFTTAGAPFYQLDAIYPYSMGWSSALRSVVLGSTNFTGYLHRMTSSEEASAVIAALSGRDEGYTAVSISSAVLLSTGTDSASYTVTYTPGGWLVAGDVIVDSGGKVLTVTGVTSTTVVTASYPSTTVTPTTGAGAYIVGTVKSKVRGKPFLSPLPVQKVWTSLQAGFARVLGPTTMSITALANVMNVKSDASAQSTLTPKGISSANGYAVAHRGNQYKAPVPRDIARAYAMAAGVEINTAFGNWELEELNATSRPLDVDKPTVAQTGRVT